MKRPRPWRGQPYLDELRPPPGWRVDLALFATYSIDLSALGAALLALCGRSDDKGSGSIADFADSVETLRGKARFMVQRGRIARPSRLPTLAGILDQFVVEVPYDEERRSWHPKAALVRYVSEDQGRRRKENERETSWRLWLGSRNLTRSTDLDAGLLLETPPGGRRKGRRVEGVGRMAAVLAERSGLGPQEAKAIVDAIADAPWLVPDGIEVVRIDMADDGVPMRAVEADGCLDAVTVVSPFLDARFLRRAATWGGEATSRTLVSTRQALVGVAQTAQFPLARFDRLLALDAPDPPLEVEPEPADARPVAPAGDDADPTPPSLHAKLFCLARDDRATLLMGSANATSRAWDGRNAELLAELKGGPAIIAGLAYLVGSATPVTIEELGRATPAKATLREELELSRRRLVSAWSPRLARDGPAFAVEVDSPGPALAAGMTLSVGLAATELAVWPAGAVRVALGDVPLGRQTDLLRCEIRSGDAAVGWMQRATVTPPLDPERDATALAGLMGFGAFQGWMRQLLSGDAIRDDGAPWDGQIEGTAATRREGDLELLTLEDIVGSWGADKRRFHRADAHFERYCDALLRHDSLTDAERSALDELRAIWRLARERLPA